jgi:lipopolysaccharide transport system permease protein
MNSEVKEQNWTTVIEPKKSLLDLNLKELWAYKDLLGMFIKRDIVTVYKQTILGPIWFLVQPIMTMLVYIFIFGNVAGLSTDGLPKALFYLSGIVIWNYFSECFNQTSDTFTQNAQIFGKVYFPRLIIPLSKVISGLIKFLIQFILFLIVFAYYSFQSDQNIDPNRYISLLPLLIVLMAGIGLGAGLIFSSLTTKYRDLKFLIVFGVQLVMYATPIIYPLSSVGGKMRALMFWNPFAHIIETFKYGFLGEGVMSWQGLAYSTGFMLVVLFLGVLIFNKTERKFMDTV